MRVATWNINGIRARLDFLVRWLGERRPDVVGLQETKVDDDLFPRAEVEAAGYRATVHGQKGWNGVAVLTREPAAVVQVGLPGGEELGARMLTVDTDGVSFTTVYVPNGKHVGHDDFPRKLAWLDALRAHFAERYDPGAPVVLCGDFNVCPTALDSWNEELLRGSIFHTDDERARFQALLRWGFTDLFRDRRPDERAFTWWDYRGGAFHRSQGLRIDFILASGALPDRARTVTIDRDYRKKKDGLTPSDHAPVVADID